VNGRLATVAAGVALVCGFAAVPLLMASGQAFACGQQLPTVVPSTSEGFQDMSPVQVRHAAEIVAAGRALNIPARGWVIALATSMQETGLHNLANNSAQYPLVAEHSMALLRAGVGDGNPGNDHDSVGLFQQRPLPPEGAGGWGTVADLMTPDTAARKFYGTLQGVPDWQSLPLSDAAQKVQRSAFPDAYAKHEDRAKELAAFISGLPDIAMIGGGGPGAECGPGTNPSDAPIVVSSAGWTQPVHAAVVSRFRPPDRPTHNGVDLSAKRFDTIRAAAAGTVIVSTCNTPDPPGCNQDGGPEIKGCGWYVEILHANNVTTRYCHHVHQPYVHVGDKVVAGQVIGQVGSSGNSSGPHLHFEVHLNVQPGKTGSQDDAVDPIAFMAANGAPLE
jgi:murein DD-endopeptidase MepM/ murein hydrolase activator NlpD